MVLTVINILIVLWVLSVIDQSSADAARLVRAPSGHGRRSA